MIHLSVNIEVKNHKEIIKSKGKTFGLISSMISNEVVEKEIKKEVIRKLEAALSEELNANGIQANVTLK